MDTKYASQNKKSSKGLGIIVPGFIIILIAIIGIALYFPIYEKAKVIYDNTSLEDISSDLYFEKNFIDVLYKGTYSLYMDLQYDIQRKEITPADVLLADNVTNNYFEEEEDFRWQFNSWIHQWKEEFQDYNISNHKLIYYIVDKDTGWFLANSDLLKLTDLDDSTINDKYPFYMELDYDSQGSIDISKFYGLEETFKRQFLRLEHEKILFEIDYYSDDYNIEWLRVNKQINSPKNIKVIFASESKDFLNNMNHNSRMLEYRMQEAFHYSGLIYVFAIALIFMFLLAMFFPFIKTWKVGKGFSSKIPAEISILGVTFSALAYFPLVIMAIKTVTDTLLPYSFSYIAYGINFIYWASFLTVWYISFLSLRQVFTLGIKRFIMEKTIFGMVSTWILSKIKGFFHSLVEFDLDESSNKEIFKILLINFFAVFILLLFGVSGVFFLVAYTIVLFYLSRKYLDDIKDKYRILLNATKNMAKGKVETSITEDVGIFEPLKEELNMVQDGFKKAVEEEVKSQNMKTELITNVSHDLKTPLTSIITYVELLKEEGTTKEDQTSYIEVIEQKANRLKRLIEDLFEVSKANSGDITLNFVQMDLVSLIKQILLELADNIEQSEIDFRNNITFDKVYVNLDSDKTYRIFENLIINVTKYGMPKSRAYIDMELIEDKVIITMKNISKEELTLEANSIGERFVRGDKSRNTEGSGLGLAIVRSFVELQGGQFDIRIDGDLFKAVITWENTSKSDN